MVRPPAQGQHLFTVSSHGRGAGGPVGSPCKGAGPLWGLHPVTPPLPLSAIPLGGVGSHTGHLEGHWSPVCNMVKMVTRTPTLESSTTASSSISASLIHPVHSKDLNSNKSETWAPVSTCGGHPLLTSDIQQMAGKSQKLCFELNNNDKVLWHS